MLRVLVLPADDHEALPPFRRVRRGLPLNWLALAGTLVFFLTHASVVDALEISQSEQAITISHEGKTVLTYHKAEVPPPAGKDPSFARSGFIHPLCAPSGFRLTSIHPDDHIHHLGLWHAWVKTEHGERKPDFWNIGKSKSGTVRFKKVIEIADKPDVKSFTVRQQHLALEAGKDPMVVLEEDFTIRASLRPAGGYTVDYITAQKNVTALPLELPAYRYGGPLAYRGPAHWNKDNSKVLTSEGKTRADGHTSRGRWVSFSGPSTAATASLAILCHPKNHDAPQRMRIWPADSHNGAIFFNYVPIQETAWAIKPGETSTMRYRIIAADGELTKKALNADWEACSEE